MNMLSVIIYLADIAPRIGAFLGTLGTLGLVAGLIMIISGKFVAWDLEWSSKEKVETLKENRKTVGDYGVRFLLTSIIMISVAIIMPSQKTFYMIAASEMGETIITHPDTIELYTELKDSVLTKLKEYNISKE